MDRLGFGVVGVNPRIRRSVLAGIVQSSRGRLVAVCSRDSGKAQQTAQEFGATGYTSYGDLLADPAVEVVFICTPNSLHHPMAIEAFAAGKWVVCEKPLAVTLAEAEEMAAAAERAGVPNAVNFTYHSLPGHAFVARLLSEQTIGALRHLDLTYWQARQALPGARPADARLDVGSHLVDLACWWCDLANGGSVRSITSQEVGPPDRAPIWMALARTDRGALLALQADRVAAGWRNGMACWLVGETGTLSLSFDTDTAEVRLARLHQGAPEGELHRVPIPADLWVSYQQFPAYHVDRLCASLIGEGYFPDFRYGLRVQRVLEAARVAAREDRWVPVD